MLNQFGEQTRDFAAYLELLLDIDAADLKPKEFAAEMGVSARLVYYWLRNEKLPSVGGKHINKMVDVLSPRLAGKPGYEWLTDIKLKSELERRLLCFQIQEEVKENRVDQSLLAKIVDVIWEHYDYSAYTSSGSLVLHFDNQLAIEINKTGASVYYTYSNNTSSMQFMTENIQLQWEYNRNDDRRL